MNQIFSVNFVLILVLSIIMGCISYKHFITTENIDDYGYILGGVADKGKEEISLKFIILSFYINIQGLVPLDTLVCIELTRFVIVIFIHLDHDLWNTEDENPLEYKKIRIQDPTLFEDLSSITHLFCDKTGTLTKNNLSFVKFFIKENL